MSIVEDEQQTVFSPYNGDLDGFVFSIYNKIDEHRLFLSLHNICLTKRKKKRFTDILIRRDKIYDSVLLL